MHEENQRKNKAKKHPKKQKEYDWSWTEGKLLLLLLHLPLTANPPLLIQKPTNGTTQSIIIKQNNHPRKKMNQNNCYHSLKSNFTLKINTNKVFSVFFLSFLEERVMM